MISGDDQVFVVSGPVAAPLNRSLSAVADRWGSLFITVNSEGLTPWQGDVEALPDGYGELALCRDAEMAERWDEEGYFVADGAGPFSILLQPLKTNPLRVQVLQDPYGGGQQSFVPYEVSIAGRDIWLVTLVTGDSTSTFADWLTRLIRENF